MKQTLIHHHIDGGEIVAAIPEGIHRDFFSKVHAFLKDKKNRGGTVNGMAGGVLTIMGSASVLTGAFTGDPDAWINAYGYGEPHVGDIKKD